MEAKKDTRGEHGKVQGTLGGVGGRSKMIIKDRLKRRKSSKISSSRISFIRRRREKYYTTKYKQQ